ncbi:MAG TPA: Gfo/Idh/MocA family oxidoreductase [Candidatus Acidoferrum sp.]|nr:Gfo/Idh/MocA family oxidoreductase [Candidatus Acidoferrum sp.]
MNLPDKAILPQRRFPIIIIGAGGIVREAHLPAYRKAGFLVDVLVDHRFDRAQTLAAEYGVKNVFNTVAEAVAKASQEAVFDVALPARAFIETLQQLPDGAHVLIQKPMGETLAQAREILELCRRKKLHAAVNCQLRYAPSAMAARQLIDSGAIGELTDVEMRLTCQTPWQLFPFLYGLPRVEILYHSVHYVDLIRSFLGEPTAVQALTLPHPNSPKLISARLRSVDTNREWLVPRRNSPELTSTRSTIIMEYNSGARATITANHNHDFGERHQESYLKWEGTRGAIWARLGLLMNYPKGVEDLFEYCVREEGRAAEWKTVALEGSWYPEAFIGTMASLQRHKEGSDATLPTSVEDVIHTMECVEAAYIASARGGISPQTLK